MEKEKLRTILKKKRIHPTQQLVNSVFIRSNITSNLNLGHRCLLYYPINKEVSLKSVGEEILKNGGELYFPVITGKHSMDFYQVLNLDTSNWEKVKGIPQPPKENKKYRDSSPDDIIFIPGIGFNREGYRMGYGGGFFDRWLPHFKGQSVGICYDVQLTDKLIPEEHDWPVNFICTEKELFATKKH